MSKWQVFHDREPVSPVLCEGDAHMWLLRNQPRSIDWALAHDGYEIRPVKSSAERTREMADYALAETVELLVNTEGIGPLEALRMVAKRIGRESERARLIWEAQQAKKQKECCLNK